MSGGPKALLVARLRILEATRDRRAFLTSLVMPLLLVAGFAVFGLFGAEVSDRNNDLTVKVAVAEATTGADELLRALEPDGIEVVRDRVPAALVVRERADLVLTVPPDADAVLAARRPMEVTLLSGPSGRSAIAVATTEAALRRIVLERGGSTDGVRIAAESVDDEPEAVASALARTIPLLALAMALPFLASGMRAVSGSRTDRSIEHLLPLPLPRRTLLLGLAMGTIGAEAVQQVLLLALLVLVSPIIVLVGAVPWTAPLLLLVAVLSASLCAGAIGVLVGSIVSSERFVSMAMGVTSGALFAAAMVLQFADRPPSGPEVTVIPLMGAVLAARAAFTDDGISAAALLGLLVGTTATVAVSIRLAARRLADGGGMRL